MKHLAIALLAAGLLPAETYYTWTSEKGQISVEDVHWGQTTDDLPHGLLRNSTEFSVVMATIRFRQYQQPGRPLVDSPIAVVSALPPGETGVFDALGTKLWAGCAVVLDSVSVILEDSTGARGQQTLKAGADAGPVWLNKPRCTREKLKYEKTSSSESADTQR